MISILNLSDAELLLLYKNHYICWDIILKTMINCINWLLARHGSFAESVVVIEDGASVSKTVILITESAYSFQLNEVNPIDMMSWKWTFFSHRICDIL